MSKIMLFAETWMQLEIIMLSELSQKEKEKYHMISPVLCCAVPSCSVISNSL